MGYIYIIATLLALTLPAKSEANMRITLECAFPEVLHDGRSMWPSLNIMYEIPGEGEWEIRDSHFQRKKIYDDEEKQEVETTISRSSGIANQRVEYTSGINKGFSMMRQGTCRKTDPKSNIF